MRGWLAEVRRHHDLHRQIAPYAKLQRQVEAFADWIILPWDADSADLFVKFRSQGLRIGSLDLKVACIALNTGHVADAQEAREAIAAVEAETGLPTDDPVRFGAARLLDSVLSRA